MVKEKIHDERKNIAMKIAQELLDREMLDQNNFCYDIDALLQCTSEIILEHLTDYMLLTGTVI